MHPTSRLLSEGVLFKFYPFFPILSAFQRYVDGALSDNMPFSSLRETITISPFSGESDISPYGNPFNFHEIYYNNVSIHVNFINAHRVVIAFFPPEPEVAYIFFNLCLIILVHFQIHTTPTYPFGIS